MDAPGELPTVGRSGPGPDPGMPPLPPPPAAGPPLPPAPPAGPRPPDIAPVTDAVLAIPLSTREIVSQALDLLTRRDAGLRGASFYIGFMLLVTLTPLVVLAGLVFTLPDLFVFEPYAEQQAWPGWMLLAAIPAGLGYVAASTEARALATAVIGGRVEGRPLRLRQSIAVARRRFWSILGAQVLIGVIAGIASLVGQLVVTLVWGPVEALTFGASLLIAVVLGAPFVYVPAGIVLGEVGVLEAISRSIRLVRLRKQLAVVVTMFGVLSQFIILFGLSTGVDALARLLIGTGLVEDFPRPLVVPIAATLVFAIGTLIFLVEAIAAAPAVHAFEALTHYTRGLEIGRREPVAGGRLWDPWVTPGLALCSLLGLIAFVGGVLALPG